MPRVELMEIGLESIVLDGLKKGSIVKKIPSLQESDERITHYRVKHMKEAMKEFYKLYSNPKTKKKDFTKVIDKHQENMHKEINHILDTIEVNDGEKLLKVIKREKKGKKLTLVFEEVNETERMDLVKSIADKLLAKLTPEQTKIMLQEGIKRLNDVEELKKIDKELDKKKVKTAVRRGCCYFKVGGHDLFLVP